MQDTVQPAMKLRPIPDRSSQPQRARTKNFDNEIVTQMTFEGEAKTIQDFYLDGKNSEAAAAMPDVLIDAIFGYWHRAEMRPGDRMLTPLAADRLTGALHVLARHEGRRYGLSARA
jgi:hypothetical protein